MDLPASLRTRVPGSPALGARWGEHRPDLSIPRLGWSGRRVPLRTAISPGLAKAIATTPIPRNRSLALFFCAGGGLLDFGKGLCSFGERLFSNVSVAVAHGGTFMTHKRHHDGIGNAGVFEQRKAGVTQRREFLNAVHMEALAALLHEWEPAAIAEPLF